MKDIKPETAPGLIKTLLWGDPGISMSLFGALPDMVNWLLELLLELGRQLNGLPEPLLKDILGQVGTGIDPGRSEGVPPGLRPAGQAPPHRGGQDPGGDAGGGDRRHKLRPGRPRPAHGPARRQPRSHRALPFRGVKALDTAALARSMRRIGLLAVSAARQPGEKTGDRKSAGKTAGAVIALLAVLVLFKKIRGR